MKILVVDDSTIVRNRIIDMLTDIKEIETIGEAKDVSEALHSFKRLKPDIVILDIRIPGGNGIDVLKKIKESKPDTKVIMLTNYPYSQYKKKCMDLGADFFFDKSTEFNKIIDVFKKLMPDSFIHCGREG